MVLMENVGMNYYKKKKNEQIKAFGTNIDILIPMWIVSTDLLKIGI